MEKVKADFLQNTKAALTIELSRVPVTLTFDQAIVTFRNAVNQKYPPSMGTNTRARRTIREVGRNNRRPGTGVNRSNNKNRYQNMNKKPHPKAEKMRLDDNTYIWYHPSFKHSNEDFGQFPNTLKERMKNERVEYNRNRNTSSVDARDREIRELRAQLELQELQSQVQTLRTLTST